MAVADAPAEIGFSNAGRGVPSHPDGEEWIIDAVVLLVTVTVTALCAKAALAVNDTSPAPIGASAPFTKRFIALAPASREPVAAAPRVRQGHAHP